VPSWSDVVALGLAFPGVELGSSYGTPALRVRNALLCRLRTDPDALVLRVIDIGEREALMQDQPDVFSPRHTTTAIPMCWFVWMQWTTGSSPN